MKKILIAGAGKSSVFLIDYLIVYAEKKHWHITIADATLQHAAEKISNNKYASAVELDIKNVAKRQLLVKENDLIISMLPPALHIELAKDCILFGKHLLTASYTDDAIKKLSKEISAKNILFLYEMGLDPGIDHMSAMQVIDDIKNKGGKITSFRSHCGGLVAPESDDNPWHYKISWNPANIVRAGKAGAVYKEDNVIKKLPYEQLFSTENKVSTGDQHFAYYANRNSLAYIELYGLHDVHTFLRTTLRHPDFIKGWKNVINLQLTNETERYQTDEVTPAAFFKKYKEEKNVQDALPNEVDELEQLIYLGLYDDAVVINKGLLSACDVLQFLLERNLALKPSDKDMIVMLHEIEYELAGKKYLHKSSLIVKGDDSVHTAMAKTVGLPLAIAATKILEGDITVRGLHIPIIPALYETVMTELESLGVKFERDEIEK